MHRIAVGQIASAVGDSGGGVFVPLHKGAKILSPYFLLFCTFTFMMCLEGSS